MAVTGTILYFVHRKKLKREKAKAAKAERRSLARNETRAVICVRAFTLIVFLATAVLVSLGVLRQGRSAQKESFESEFNTQANKVLESFHDSVEQFMASFDSLSSTITSYAIDTQSNFPVSLVLYVSFKKLRERCLTYVHS